MDAAFYIPASTKSRTAAQKPTSGSTPGIGSGETLKAARRSEKRAAELSPVFQPRRNYFSTEIISRQHKPEESTCRNPHLIPPSSPPTTRSSRRCSTRTPGATSLAATRRAGRGRRSRAVAVLPARRRASVRPRHAGERLVAVHDAAGVHRGRREMAAGISGVQSAGGVMRCIVKSRDMRRRALRGLEWRRCRNGFQDREAARIPARGLLVAF
jgi:hypothetical protein